MEKEDNNAAPVTTTALVKVEKKKKRSLLSVIRATLIAIRRRRRRCRCRSLGKTSSISADKIDSANTADHGVLKRLFGCIRPLHLQPDDEYRRPFPLLLPPLSNGHDSFHDVCLPLPSPTCSSGNRSSRYASAEDLVGLHDATEGSEGCEEEGGVPNAINKRAEEFIMMFYEQMRLQRSDSLLRHAVTGKL